MRKVIKKLRYLWLSVGAFALFGLAALGGSAAPMPPLCEDEVTPQGWECNRPDCAPPMGCCYCEA